MQVGKGLREGGTEDPKWVCADSSEPHVGLELMSRDIMTRAESDTQLA